MTKKKYEKPAIVMVVNVNTPIVAVAKSGMGMCKVTFK